MKFFKLKYLIASLVIHSALVSFFLLSENSSQKAETTMLVTEIIKIEEKSKSSDAKKTKKTKIKNEKKININKKPKKENIPIKVILKPEEIPKEFISSQILTQSQNNVEKQALTVNKQIKKVKPSDKKLNNEKFNENKNLSKANYKIGSINNPHPPYPIMARKKGLQGKLILKVSVNNDGSVKNVIIGKSSGHKILDTISKETIEKWIFIPAIRMGRAVEDNIQVPIRFVLTE